MNTVLSISEIRYTAVNVFLFIVIFPTYLIFFRILLVRIPFRFFFLYFKLPIFRQFLKLWRKISIPLPNDFSKSYVHVPSKSKSFESVICNSSYCSSYMYCIYIQYRQRGSALPPRYFLLWKIYLYCVILYCFDQQVELLYMFKIPAVLSWLVM